MVRETLLAVLGVAVIILCANPAAAGTLTLKFEGTARGNLGSLSFPLTAFSITSNADSNDRQAFSTGWSLEHYNSSITLSGIGTCAITSSTRTFVNNASSIVGFSQGTLEGADLIDGPTNPAFSTWVLLSYIGPVSGTGTIHMPSVFTSCGYLSFLNGTTPITFTVTPEPSGLALLALAVTLVPFRIWRPRRVS